MTRNALPLLALVVLTAPLLAGCVELQEDRDTSPSPSATPTTTSKPASGGGASGSGAGMTAKEASAITTSPCAANDADLPGKRLAFCAHKTQWMDGTIDLATLPVNLKGFNGAIEVKGGTAGAWNLTVVLSAKGDTEASARSNLENIQFTWSHQSGSSHHLDAEAKKKVAATNNQEAARMTLIMPAAVVLTVTATTTNGDTVARGVRADDVSLTTTNGRVAALDLEADKVTLRSTNGEAEITSVEADIIDVATSNAAVDIEANARDVKVTSTNGGIDVKVRPTGVGEISIQSSNGLVNLMVPEDASHGYDLSAGTTNGMVEISLEDGSQSGSATSKTFKTSNYAGRTIRTKATIATTNAMVEVAPL